MREGLELTNPYGLIVHRAKSSCASQLLLVSAGGAMNRARALTFPLPEICWAGVGTVSV